jgi:predicted SprT family Zn-dependent metalloprotease
MLILDSIPAEQYPMSTPTLELYQSLENAYEHFNTELFKGTLPPCLITLRSVNRIYGYHHSERFINMEGTLIDELGLHPGHFTLRSVEAVLSTLVHEMVHHWQHHFGTPTRSNPHNQEWAAKMRAIGLNPSNTGLPGGKASGKKVSHYIEPAGAYEQACQVLLAKGFELKWFDRHLPTQPDHEAALQTKLQEAGVAVKKTPPPIELLPKIKDKTDAKIEKPATYRPQPKKAATRLKYECLNCQAKVWTSKEVAMMCIPCGKPLENLSATPTENEENNESSA